MKNKYVVIVSLISVLFTMSCGNKHVDKSMYEIIDLRDAHLQNNYSVSHPDANGTKMFAAQAIYCDVSEAIRIFMGFRKGQVVFGELETDVKTDRYVNLSAFKIKGKKPDMEDGQPVTIYFRLERKKGLIRKLEIDLIETN